MADFDCKENNTSHALIHMVEIPTYVKIILLNMCPLFTPHDYNAVTPNAHSVACTMFGEFLLRIGAL